MLGIRRSGRLAWKVLQGGELGHLSMPQMKKSKHLLLAAALIVSVLCQAESVLGLGEDGAVEVISDHIGADISAQPEEFVKVGDQIWCREAHAEIHGVRR